MLVDYPILTLLVFLPALGAMLCYVTGSPGAARGVALATSLVVLGLATLLLAGFLWPDAIVLSKITTPGSHTYFAVEKSPSVPTLNVNYFLGADELSVVLVFLNALLTPLALAISWDEHSRVPEFFAMFLFMETTISGVFLSLDLFQFLVFWEVGLVPMYFLIAVWGGPRRRYAAFKFFLYTFLASLPLLVAVFAFYLYSSPHTFDMTVIISTLPIPPGPLADLAFVGLLIAFGTKLPTWPLHTWLPDAHVEAPTGASVILAGVLLKLGGYGLIRFNVQMLPTAAVDLYWLLALVGIISILYGAFVCIAQDDLKRLVAFSSVSHMGFVTLGIAAGVYGFTSGGGYGRGAVLGFSGAIFQMFAHGLVSAALFMVAGSLGHMIGTRNISELGGIAKRAPRVAIFMMVSFLASLGLPGLVGFVAEFSVFVGVYAAFGFAWRKRPDLLWTFALGGTGLATFVTIDMMGLGNTNALHLALWPSPVGVSGNFTGELKMNVDAFALFFQVMFEFVAFLVILASRGFLRPEEPHQGEYYALMLLAVVGMMFTAAATDLFVLFLAFETSSLSTFALVAYRKRDKQATEASVKFFIIGSVSSGIVLFGISLIYGIAGTTSIGTTTDLLLLRGPPGLTLAGHPDVESPLIVALVLLIAGFGFKVAVVPFHMWAPDVYQGSPTTISVLLTAASKNVGIVALFRVFLIGLLNVQIDWIAALAVLAIATQTVGNIVAIPQRSVKRMLAYSSIAQAGYILIAIPVGAVALHSTSPGDNASRIAIAGLVGGMLHVFVYAAMKAGAFLVVAGTEARGIPDDMEAYKGLSRRMPFLAFAMTVFLFSLAGIPPLGGFFSKFVLFSSAVNAASFNGWFLALAVSGVLNSALSLYYYARVVWYMYILDPEGEARKVEVPRAIEGAVFIALAIVMLTAVLAAFFLGFLNDAARGFFGF